MTDETNGVQDLEMSEDMENQSAATDQVPEGSYHWRVSSVTKHDGEGTNGAARLVFALKCQTEGEAFGRTVNFGCDMGDPRGRSNVKTVYNAVGYKPVGSGHNPAKTIDGEFLANIKHNVSKGVTYANINPFTIKPLIG